ncbi:MAG: Ig-like domain-containing protein [Acidobacteria bacterium]|nr:Ig-like domain-containing protein [Acidobacteriota bacterium]
MSRGFLFRSVGTVTLFAYLVGTLSCARDQQLVSITVEPNIENFGVIDPSLSVQLRALGSYIHPPVTKDITNQVTWVSNAPEVATVTSTGLLSPGGTACGNATVSATLTTNRSGGNRTSSGAIVTGFMTTNVACPGSSFVLNVTFAGAGTGTVTGSVNCTSTCTGTFPSGTTATLDATASGASTFGGWSGCDSVSGTTCTVLMNNNRGVTVTFN